ncbi:MAG: phosphoenolpyruvate--protein phosphotransferase [Myxococcota bacterium]
MSANDHTVQGVLSGIDASPGIAIGEAHVLRASQLSVPVYEIDAESVEREIGRFWHAVERSREQILAVKEQMTGPEAIGHILDAHLMILEDVMVVEETSRNIQLHRVNAEQALRMIVDQVTDLFNAVDDEYIRERQRDLQVVVDRVTRNLLGEQPETIPKPAAEMIVVAHDLSPADTAQLDRKSVMGFITDAGGKTSHTAITARALEIPAVVGLENVTTRVAPGDLLVVDGCTGVVHVNPDAATIARYRKKREEYLALEKEFLRYTDLPAETRDGYQIRLVGNVELVDEIPSLLAHGGAGVGLFRTEFLYMKRAELPDEEEHYRIYSSVIERVAPHPAVIRTLDLGGDKFSTPVDLPTESNPALGLRAIRFCLREPGLFKTQLAGILRASVHGAARIMLPLITDVSEIRETRAILEEVKKDLQARGERYDPDVPLGIMVETPSSAMISDLLATEADFFSIGTNDLIQYTLAVDRGNEQVAYLYAPLHPANLRLIRNVVESGHNAGIPVMMCGEMANDPRNILILIGLGLDELSMNPLAIPCVKRIVRGTTLAEARKIVEHALELRTAEEVGLFLQEEMDRRFPGVLPD